MGPLLAAPHETFGLPPLREFSPITVHQSLLFLAFSFQCIDLPPISASEKVIFCGSRSFPLSVPSFPPPRMMPLLSLRIPLPPPYSFPVVTPSASQSRFRRSIFPLGDSSLPENPSDHLLPFLFSPIIYVQGQGRVSQPPLFFPPPILKISPSSFLFFPLPRLGVPPPVAVSKGK